MGSTLRRKYHLDSLLGIGGAGAVFAATHRNGKRVALKILHPELAKRSDMRARFLREGYVANKIQHEGVVRVLDDDDDEEENTVFLVMDLLEGESLERQWERFSRRLPLAAALAHADDLLDVLAAAHHVGIVHRDVKPDNLFITSTGMLKVLDFGIARLLDGSGATRSGEIFGTPAFMPPEQATGRVREIDARSDVWSVGAVIWTLLTGVHVHEAPHLIQQMVYAGTQEARPLSTVRASIPAAAASVVDRALAFRPDARWQSAREMQEALRATGLYQPRVATTIAPPVKTEVTVFAGGPTISATSTLVQGGARSEDDSDDNAIPLRRRE